MGISCEVVNLAALGRGGRSPVTGGGAGAVGGGGGGGGIGGAANEVWIWVDVEEFNRLSGGSGGFSFADLKAKGVSGISLSNNTDVRSISAAPGWLIGEMQSARAVGLKISYGPYCARIAPPNTAGERAAWLNGWSIIKADCDSVPTDAANADMEPYTGLDTAWNGSDHAAYVTMGADWAAIMAGLQVILYPSSNFSWPGSNNDEIRIQNGGPGSYATSRAPDLLDGYFGAGGSAHLLDASFHLGKQNNIPATMADAIARLVSLTHSRFATSTSGPMFWPDNRERSPGPPGSFFSPGEVQGMIVDSIANSSGPTMIYQQNLTTGLYVPQWDAFLDAIHAATL